MNENNRSNIFYLFKFLQIIDIYGVKIQLNLQKYNSSKTVLGGIFTIFTIGFVMWSAWSIGKDIFYHKEPLISIEDNIFSKRPKLYLDKNSMPFAITLQDYNQKSYNLPRYFKYEIFESLVYNKNYSSINTYYNLTQCSHENFPVTTQDYFEKSGLSNYLCIANQNMTIEGYMDEEYIQQIYLRIRLCDNQTDGGDCAPIEEIKNFIDERPITWSLYFQNSIVNIQNPDPISQYTLNLYKNIRLSVYRTYNIFIKPQTVLTDVGLIFTDIYKSICLSHDKSVIDESDYKPTLPLIDIVLSVGEHENIYKRSYIKFQSIVANLGGLLKASMFIFYIFSFYFSKLKIYEKLANSVINFKEEDFSNKIINKSLDKINIGLADINSVNKIKNNSHNFLNASVKPLEINPKILNIEQITKCSKNNSIIKKQKIYFGFFEIVLYLCCYICRKNEKIPKKFQIFNESNQYINKKLDVRNLIKSSEELKCFKTLILESWQIELINLIHRSSYKEFLSKMEKANLNEIESEKLKYIKGKILKIIHNSDDVTEIDRRFFNLIPQDLFSFIINNN
jgi:hypothetical protein